MLRRLSIKNFTLIEQLEVDLQGGFTAITGETGSGKSIILGALGLLLGNRAEGNLLHDPERKCVIEALWDTSSKEMQAFLKEKELDLEKESVLRREITPAGKSRLFFNDTPVTAATMKAFREITIDIHSQHEHSTLRSSNTQLDILDAFAQQEKRVKAYAEDYKIQQQRKAKLVALEEEQMQRERDRDYLNFQHNELSEANLDALLNRDLEGELNTLAHAEEIRNQLNEAATLFDAGDFSPTAALRQIKSIVSEAARLSPQLEELSQRMDSLAIEWEDLEQEIANTAEATEVDDEQLSIVRDQFDTLQKLLHKHGKLDAEELAVLRDELGENLKETANFSDQIEKLNAEINAAEKALIDQAAVITKARKKAAIEANEAIVKTLAGLSMPHAEADIRLEKTVAPTPKGMDAVAFLFKTNKGGRFGPLDKVASGGELSRMMLALKGAIAQRQALPIMIFDEIDTGVSGEVAHQMGALMRKMSKNQQMIAITHLPQIAGKAHQHWRVSKDDSSLKTVSLMEVLSPEERVVEIATMLSGDKLTDAALEQAKVLLEG